MSYQSIRDKNILIYYNNNCSAMWRTHCCIEFRLNRFGQKISIGSESPTITRWTAVVMGSFSVRFIELLLSLTILRRAHVTQRKG